MVSHSNFGSDTSEGSIKVRKAVEQLHREFPDLAVDGEMQIGRMPLLVPSINFRAWEVGTLSYLQACGTQVLSF